MSYDPATKIQELSAFGEFGGVNPSITDSSTYTFLKSETMKELFESEIKASNVDSFLLGRVTKEANINIDSVNFGMVEDYRKISNDVINL